MYSTLLQYWLIIYTFLLKVLQTRITDWDFRLCNHNFTAFRKIKVVNLNLYFIYIFLHLLYINITHKQLHPPAAMNAFKYILLHRRIKSLLPSMMERPQIKPSATCRPFVPISSIRQELLLSILNNQTVSNPVRR